MAGKRRATARWPKGAEALLAGILLDAYGADERLWALLQTFVDSVPLPADASVPAQSVSVVRIDCDGNTRLGLTATCRLRTATKYVAAVHEVVFSADSEGARYVAANRRWSGEEPT